METGKKYTLIISVIILLVLCAGATVFAFRTDLKCLWWYVQCRTFEKDNQDYKLDIVYKLEKTKGVKILCWMLEDNNSQVRLYAAYALGELGDKRAVKSLIIALKDIDWSVRYNTVNALGELGDKRAINPLKKALAVRKNNFMREWIKLAIEKLESVPDTPSPRLRSTSTPSPIIRR